MPSFNNLKDLYNYAKKGVEQNAKQIAMEQSEGKITTSDTKCSNCGNVEYEILKNGIAKCTKCNEEIPINYNIKIN